MDSMIFDVDGTLWDSTAPVLKAWNEVLERNKCPREKLTIEELKGLFGKPMNVICDELFPALSMEQREKIGRECFEYENEVLEREPGTLYDGVASTIKSLSERYPLYIVSNCQLGYIELFYRGSGLERYFKGKLCYGDTKLSKGKTMSMLVKKYGLKEPVYIGDTKGDADACREAGVPFVFASYGFGNVEDARLRIDKFEELDELTRVI